MDIPFWVHRARHNWAERADFFLDRPDGTEDHLFLHFKSPVLLTLADDPPRRIEAGTCLLLTPHTPHAFSPLDGDLLHDWMHFDPAEEYRLTALGIPTNTFWTPMDSRFITESIRQIEEELLTQRPFYDRVIAAAVETLFVLLARSLTTSPAPAQQQGHRAAFEALRLDLFRNPDRYHSTEDMAKAVQLSRSRFSVLYHKLFRTAPIRDLIRARTERAAYYLSLGNLSISEIAARCGYRNDYHFIRQFKEEMGMTPGTFRKSR